MAQEEAARKWKNFFVAIGGRTHGAHQTFVDKLKAGGHIQVDSPEQSHYMVVFCPVVSRVAVEVRDALENIPDDKPIILVVMHYTFNRDQVVAPSRRVVENPNVYLTVDCLFHEKKLLQCERNDRAWDEIRKFLGISLIPIGNLAAALKRAGEKFHHSTGEKRKFFVLVKGKTHGAHQFFVDKLKAGGHIPVDSPEQSHYMVVFCPVVSRVAVEVHDALENIPDDKPIILVVMHHTFNGDQVVAPSRRVVENPNVHLTVDCLFHEKKLLRCDRNKRAWDEIRRFELNLSSS